MVLDKTGFAAPEVAFVGDRLYTDVATGVKNGAVGLLVLTGETHLEDVPDFRGAAGCHLCLTGRDGPAALSIVKSAYNLR